MKLKKLVKRFEPYTFIRVWGNDEDIPLYSGEAQLLPKKIGKLKLKKPGEDELAYPIEFRIDCCDIESHVAIQVWED